MSGSVLRVTPVLLRRGKPRPRAGMFPDKYRRVPTLLKPQQGGQQYFADFLTRRANDELVEQETAMQQQQQRAMTGGPLANGFYYGGSQPREGGAGAGMLAGGSEEEQLQWMRQHAAGLAPRLPQHDLQGMLHQTTEEAIQAEMQQLRTMDGFISQRGFNERQWYEEERERMRRGGGAGAAAPQTETTRQILETDGLSESPAAHDGDSVTPPPTTTGGLPERILGDDYFQHRYGFSLLRHTAAAEKMDQRSSLPPHLQGHPAAALLAMQQQSSNATTAEGGHQGGLTAYSQLDLWAELPKYHREMVFLYLISRRRNTYAVAYDYLGKRFLHPYTAGNRGLKGGDRGFRGDGSTDNGHQVTSAYLNDLIPKIRERRAEDGLPPLKRGDKVDLVVRVMGFYNGRQGAVRAVQDRSAEFNVRYVEDVTPFPLNGPKMPRGVFR